MILDDPIHTERFAAMADYAIIDAEPIKLDRINSSDIVFCNTKRLRELFKVLEHATKKIVLISSQLHGTPCSDYNVHEAYAKIFPWDKVSHWFIKNKNFYGGGTSIPIGILPDKVDEMKRALSEPVKGKYSLYANGTINTNMGEREPAFVNANKVPDAYVYSGEHIPFSQYIRDIRDSLYVLCPPGYGLDTWRFWETLYMGRIPVVKRSPLMEDYAKLFDIILLDFWEELEDLGLIAYQRLHEQRNRMVDTNASLGFLNFSTWETLIRSHV